MGEKRVVRQVPATTGVVGHDVSFAGDKVVLGYIAIMALMESIEAEEVRASGAGGGGAFGGPCQRRTIVAGQPNWAFSERCR